jgi:hypothetical protein
MEKPIIKLNPLEKTAIHVATEKSFKELMNVFESGEWAWRGGETPRSKANQSSRNPWDINGENTCVDAGFDYKLGVKGEFGFGNKNLYLKEGWKVILKEEFYETQPDVTPKKITEINSYYDNLPQTQ